MKAIGVSFSAIFSVLVATILTPQVGEYEWQVYLGIYIALVAIGVTLVFRRFESLYWLLCLHLVGAPFIALALFIFILTIG